MKTPQRLQGLSPEEKLAAAQREAAKWAAIAADPLLGKEAAAFVRDLARSANAEVELRLKGLGRQQPKGGENSLTPHGPKLPPDLPSLDPLIRAGNFPSRYTRRPTGTSCHGARHPSGAAPTPGLLMTRSSAFKMAAAPNQAS
ncbi:MAG: hypothetical protein WAU78_00775 [Roseiarcus sp.]|jgi:hypothetical protein